MANVAKCYYQYNNHKYHTIDELYLGVLANMEQKESLLGKVAHTYEPPLPKAKKATAAYGTFVKKRNTKNINIKIKDSIGLNEQLAKPNFIFTTEANPDLKLYGVIANRQTRVYTETGMPLDSIAQNNKAFFSTGDAALEFVNKFFAEGTYDALPDESKRFFKATVSNKQDEVISFIESKANNIYLASDSKYKHFDTGKEYDRVSRVINGGKEIVGKYVEESKLFGSAIDKLNRDIMNGTVRNYTDYTTTAQSLLFATDTAFNNYVKELLAFKQVLESRGEKIVTNNGNEIYLYDDEYSTAGAVDLLTVDAHGNIHIYDYKLSRGDQFTHSYAGEKIIKYDSEQRGESNRTKHTKQQSYYKALFEKMYNLPIKSINIISIRGNQYDTGDTSLKYAEFNIEVQLTPIAINLAKLRPSIPQLSFAEYFTTNPITEEYLAEADRMFEEDKVNEYRIQTEQGVQRIVDEDGFYSLTPVEGDGESVIGKKDKFIEALAKHLAYEDYKKQTHQNIQENTVNQNDPINVTLPVTEKEIDDLLTPVLPQRAKEDVIVKGGIKYFDKYFEGDRLNPENLDLLLNEFIVSTSKDSHKAVLQVLAANKKAFQNVPIIINPELTTKGSVNIKEGDVVAIYINPNNIKNNNDAMKVMMEEMLHAITYQKLRTDGRKNLEAIHKLAIDNFGEEKMKMYADMEETFRLLRIKQATSSLTANEQKEYDDIKNNSEFNNVYYRLKNLDEFTVGIMVSQGFQQYLNSIDIESDTTGKVKTLWDKIKDLFLQLLGYTDASNPVLKTALYEALSLTKDAAELYAQNPEMLDVLGEHRKTVNEVNNLFNLRDVDGNLNRIANVEEVANFINTYIYNLAAVANQDGTVKVYYTSALMLNAGEETSENGNTESGKMETTANFRTRIKSYIDNLKQRERSLIKSLNTEANTELMTDEEFKEFSIKQNKLESQLEYVQTLLRNVTEKGDINVNNLIKLKEQALGELENIEHFVQQGMNGSDIKYALETTKFWLEARKMLFSKADYKDKAMLEAFSDLEVKANLVDTNVVKHLEDYIMKELVEKETGNSYSLPLLLKQLKDTGKLSIEVADLSTVDNPILNALSKHIKEKDVRLTKKRYDRVQQFEKTVKNAAKVLKSYSNNKNDIYEIFRQLDENGNKTRNMVERVSNQYRKRRGVLYPFYQRGEKGKGEAYIAFNFLREHTELANIQALFPENDADFDKAVYDAEVTRLKTLLGDKHFTEWYAKQERKIKSYKQYKQIKIDDILKKHNLDSEDQIKDNAEASAMLSVLEERLNPYKLMDKLNNDAITANPFTLQYGYENIKYIEDIPKKDFVNAAGTKIQFENYDSKFKIIEDNPELLAVYEEFQDIMRYVGKLIPFDSAEHLSQGRIPEFKKSVLALLGEDIKNGLSITNEALVDMLRTENFDTNSQTTDVITGKKKRHVKLGISKSDFAIQRDIAAARIKKMAETGKALTAEDENAIKTAINTKYAEDMEFDLGKVFRSYLSLGLAYETKTDIEDMAVLTQAMFENQAEYERDNKGNPIINNDVKSHRAYMAKDKNVSFVQQKRLLDHTLNSLLYDDRRDIKSTKTKKYTKAEKAQKDLFENYLKDLKEQRDNGDITFEAYNLQAVKINRYIESLGAYGDTEKWIDIPLKYTQYTGMGWNWISGISNMGFGAVTNLIEGAGEEAYTRSELIDAYKKVMHSVGRNYTFNKWTTAEAAKIRSLMDEFDIMAESGKEYNTLVGEDITAKLKWASAFNVNQRTEYINQAPLMILMMDKTKFNHNGKEYSLYEGFNIDGTWNTEDFGEYPEALVTKTVTKIKALIQRNHGNYNPLAPMLIKRTGLGRLLIQFRSWMVEGYRVRFGDKNGRYDPIFETTVKGRYHSVADIYKNNNVLGTTKAVLLQVLKNYLPIKNSWTPLDSYFKGGNVTPTDIANMKRVAMEINILIAAYLAGMGLAALGSGLDDEDDIRKKGLNFLSNQMSRMKTDILMYTNPLEALKIIQDPVPALRTLTNFKRVGDAFYDTIIDGTPEYENGIYEGHYKLFKTSMMASPFGSAYYKSLSNTLQNFDEK